MPQEAERIADPQASSRANRYEEEEEKVEEEKDHDLGVEQQSGDIPEILQALELFPWVEPDDMLRIYNDCGRRKDILVETLLSSQPEDPIIKGHKARNQEVHGGVQLDEVRQSLSR